MLGAGEGELRSFAKRSLLPGQESLDQVLFLHMFSLLNFDKLTGVLEKQ